MIMVLAELISQYLESNRRLVVPQIGAFLVKEPEHKVLFSTLVKRDDGVLRELLTSSGLSELETEALIGRLVFEVRYALENQQEYSLVGVGTFSGDENGALHFTEWCDEQSIPQEEVAESQPEPTIEPEPVAEPVVETELVVEPEPVAEIATKPKAAMSRAPKPKKSSLDMWLIVAVAAAVIALGAILYGFVLERSQNDFEDDYDYSTLIDEEIN